MLRSFFSSACFAVGLGLLAGCAASSDAGSSNENYVSATEYRLAGVAETVLLADENGRVSVAKLGDPTTVAAPAIESGAPIVGGRSFDGHFWLLDQDGSLLVVDPAGGAPTKRALGLPNGGDIEIDNMHSAWVSAGAKIAHVDPSTGKTLATLDLASHALDGGQVHATGIKRVGDRLFVQLGREKDRVQRGAVLVVDPAAERVESVIELQVGNEIGYDPGGAMVVDTVHGKLLLTARGFRPSNTGMVLRIDLAQKTLDPWFFRGGSGFQGGLAMGPDPATIFIAFHTSTPVASTHVFHYRIGSDGEMEVQDNASLLDAFEEVDDYPANASSTLFALPVTCPAGFCIGGRGVSFIDAKTAKPFPRFSEAAIGMSPEFVLFL